MAFQDNVQLYSAFDPSLTRKSVLSFPNPKGCPWIQAHLDLRKCRQFVDPVVAAHPMA